MLLLGFGALLMVSCNDLAFHTLDSPKGHMDFYLTDAPGDYQEVNIDVQGLSIHWSPADMDTASADTTSSDTTDGEWIDIPFESMKVNLLELTGDVDTLLSSADLVPGFYNGLRLHLGTDNDVMVDSVTHLLTVPSGQQSGYKIQFETHLESGQSLDVTVDFDAARSVHQTGNDRYILRPVLTAFSEEGDGVDASAES